jgi:hypothetical protein
MILCKADKIGKAIMLLYKIMRLKIILSTMEVMLITNKETMVSMICLIIDSNLKHNSQIQIIKIAGLDSSMNKLILFIRWRNLGFFLKTRLERKI